MAFVVGNPFLPLYLLFGCFLHSLSESLVHDWRLDHLWYFSFLCSLSAGPLLVVDFPSRGMLQLPCLLGVFVCLSSNTFSLQAATLFTLFHFSYKSCTCIWLFLIVFNCLYHQYRISACLLFHLPICLHVQILFIMQIITFFFPILLPDGSHVYCTVSSDAFCNPMVIKWTDYLVGSCLLISIEFTRLTSCKMILAYSSCACILHIDV